MPPPPSETRLNPRRQDVPPGEPESSAPAGHPLISLVLFGHLFFVVLALSANYAPSRLQQRLLERFAFYTRALNFDLNYTPYYFTHGTIADVDHRIEVLPQGKEPGQDADWLVLPPGGFRGGEPYKRYQRLAAAMAFFADDDVTAGRIAESVGSSWAKYSGIPPRQIRSRKHLLQPMDAVSGGTAAERDAQNASYFRVPYAANCIVNDDRTVNVVKIEDASQVASPTETTNRTP